MMKLYYSAGSCSTSCHITLEEAGLKYEALEVDFDEPNSPRVQEIEKLNPLGTLPILITEDGKQLDQNLAIHTYVADLAPEKNLLPKFGTVERAQAMNWLSFVTTDLHKSIGGMFSIPGMSKDENVKQEVRKYMVGRANEYIKYMDDHLKSKEYLMGAQFTPADGYAFVVLGWTKWLDVPLAPFKNVEAYMKRVSERQAVQKVLKAEGLI